MLPSDVSELAWALLVSALWLVAVSWALVFAVVVGGTVRRGRH